MFHFCHSSSPSALSTKKTSHRVQFSLAERQKSWSYRSDAFLANTVILLISIILFSINTYFWGLTIWDLEGASDSACPLYVYTGCKYCHHPDTIFHINSVNNLFIAFFDMLHNLYFSLQNFVCFINFYFLFINIHVLHNGCTEIYISSLAAKGFRHMVLTAEPWFPFTSACSTSSTHRCQALSPQ